MILPPFQESKIWYVNGLISSFAHQFHTSAQTNMMVRVHYTCESLHIEMTVNKQPLSTPYLD